jgi:hypothetical protein
VNNNISADEIYRSCLRFLKCPDTLAIKNQIKENRDKLLYEAIEWILRSPQYASWEKGDIVCLLWIKGGAGKGKTMMSIGLIEQLSLMQDTVVTYFFCQNANYELNTLEAIVKGLILRLMNQQKQLRELLQRRWDVAKERFEEDVTWRSLWDVLLEMLDSCTCERVYVIIDALDECRDDNMTDLLRVLVRTGLHRPSKIKWLLTSRPLDSAEQELLAGRDQTLVSLEVNSEHVAEAVKTYIAFKTNELDRRRKYGEKLRQEIEAELFDKAEGTYLWVNLVCKRLESVRSDQALAEIRHLPPGLQSFYGRIIHELSKGEPSDVEGCMRLLKIMILVYRPLSVTEFRGVMGLSDQSIAVEAWIDRCASFCRIRGTAVEFVHKSARDYLVGDDIKKIFDTVRNIDHAELALNCVSHLTQTLKVNLADLPYPHSLQQSAELNPLLTSLRYAATFWARHIEDAGSISPRRVKARDKGSNPLVQAALTEQGQVGIFLRTRLLEWLECLSLLDSLPSAIETLEILANLDDVSTGI